MRFAEPDPMEEEGSDRRAFPALGSQRPRLPVPEVPVSFAESKSGRSPPDLEKPSSPSLAAPERPGVVRLLLSHPRPRDTEAFVTIACCSGTPECRSPPSTSSESSSPRAWVLKSLRHHRLLPRNVWMSSAGFSISGVLAPAAKKLLPDPPTPGPEPEPEPGDRAISPAAQQRLAADADLAALDPRS